jgi:AraC-like DNA-binding protein
VEAPAILWLFPGLLHSYRPSTPWQQSWILFSGSATEALAKLGYLDPTTPVRRYADPRALERAFAKLLRITRDHGSDVQAAAALYELIATAQDQPGSDIVDRLKALARRPLTIKQYADELGLSVDALRETVRKATGSTPQDVILTTRLNEAKALLAESDLPVAAIARQVGYDDAAYFSRLFTARVGTPPRTFRRIGSISARRSSF